MSGANAEIRGRIAVIRFSHPPVNSLAHAMRQGIARELEAALADEDIDAVILTGEGRAFCAGAEISEFNTPAIGAAPTAHHIWAAIEGSSKPVIAAINGLAMGGGLEFAMTCHYRVAVPDAPLALSEVKLGLLPGAGGTQRLPRAVGVTRALAMTTTGEAMRAEDALGTLLVDRCARPGEDAVDAALAFAGGLGRGEPLRRLRDLPVGAAPGAFDEARSRMAQRFPGLEAPQKIIDCVEAAATLPFDEGIRVERAKFQELVNGVQSKALRRAFFGERRVARSDAFPELAKLVGERLSARYREEAMRLRSQGVHPAYIDRVMKNWGMASGPFDGEGTDPPESPGGKTIAAEEIVERCILGMVNEAATLLEAGRAEGPVELDMACLHECGFPRHRGGPLFYANTVGIGEAVAAMSRRAQATGDQAWMPARLLVRMAQEGAAFQ